MTDAMIQVENLTRTYPSGTGTVDALSDVSFSIQPGRIAALVGRSGAGKTTLLNCIGGLDTTTSGRVIVDGTDVATLDDRARTALRRDKIAFVFQTFGLLPLLTAAENVSLPLRLRRLDPAEREERVAHYLDLVGLGAQAQQRPGELSGGQQQRVAIARALAGRPRLLIADEPTGQLDADTGASILTLLRDVVRAEGTTAIISTHDPKIEAVADQVIRLADGRVQPDKVRRGRHANHDGEPHEER